MTPQEHMLMALMFTRLHDRINGLCEALKANNVIAEHDPEMHFQFVIEEHPEKMAEWLQSYYDTYLDTAKRLGVVTGLKPRQTPQT